MNAQEKLFSYVSATGVAYCDRSVNHDGDYKALAHLSFKTLELTWIASNMPEDLRALVLEDANRLQVRRGEQYPYSEAGQTITLGHGVAT